MRKAFLTRTETGTAGIFGTLVTDSGFTCRSVENSSLSIPVGVYSCTWRFSPAHGMCYHVEDVPGRTFIEIHAANWARQLLGCIAPGESVGIIEGEKGVTASVATLAALEQDLGKEDFELTIEENFQ